ncbi:MAG: mechanosensitive ion channel [Candidatus Krumholzibacteriia bacterium]
MEASTTADKAIETLIALGTTYGLAVIGALAILLIGRFAAGAVRNAIVRMMSLRGADPSLTGFLSNLAFFAVVAFAFIAALAKFGVQTASFVAVLGAAGFAVGLALQGSLSNFASGVMLLMFRPFRVGDYIEAAGVAGSVKEIQIFNTVISTPDNVKITIPNSKIYGDVIRNYAGYETRRVEWNVGISYGASIEQALRVVLEVLRGDERVLADPEPMAAVANLGDSSVDLVVRGWTTGAAYWAVKFDLTRRIKEQLDAAGIEIPFPQRVVHVSTVPAAPVVAEATSAAAVHSPQS